MLPTKSLTSHTNSSKAVTYTYDANGSVELGYADGTARGEAGENPASDTAAGIGKVWYRTSALNSTLFAVDADGAVVAHMIYDPWGDVCERRQWREERAKRSGSGGSITSEASEATHAATGGALLETYTDANFSGLDNLNNFTGYAWDETLGLYYAQNRFYDAATHRFTQEDALRDGGNWYAYCGNNPLVYVDPWGYWTVAFGGEFAGALGIRVSIGAQIVIDGEGNIGYLEYSSLGVGTPTIGAALILTFTNAENILQLSGHGGAAGGSLSMLAGVGVETNMGGNGFDSPAGITFSFGASLPPAEVHAELTDTEVTVIGNWKNLVSKFEGIVSRYFSQLSCAQKEQVRSITGRDW